MNYVFSRGLEVHAIEEGLIIPNIVERPELRGVQKTAATHSVDSQKVAECCSAIAQAETPSLGAERTVVRVDVPEDPARPQGGACRDTCHQAGLVAEFGQRRSRNDFHALDGAGWQLSREYLALLVADGLPIDDEADLCVIAQRVEETITIGRHTARAIDDRLAQAGARVEGGELHDQVPVCIDVGRRIDLQQVGAGCFDRDGSLRSGDGHGGFELDRHSAANGNILREGIEAACLDFQVIRIGRDIAQLERTVQSGRRGLLIAGDRIVDRDRCFRDGRAGGVEDLPLDRAGVAERLCKYVAHGEGERTEDSDSEKSLHTVKYRGGI